jgi:hypothetical protein
VVLRIKKPYPNQPGFAIAKATALRGVNPDKLVALFVVSLNFACSYNECHHKLLCFFLNLKNVMNKFKWLKES